MIGKGSLNIGTDCLIEGDMFSIYIIRSSIVIVIIIVIIDVIVIRIVIIRIGTGHGSSKKFLMIFREKDVEDI